MRLKKFIKLSIYNSIRYTSRGIVKLITFFYTAKERKISKYKSQYDEADKQRKNKPNYSILPTDADIKIVALNMEVGDITNNTNYSGIQQLGNYFSPIGDDKPHTVIITQCNKYHSHTIAEIKVTNQLYSEWIVACCNTMWHTEHKTFKDIHGNSYPVGKLLECTATIKY